MRLFSRRRRAAAAMATARPPALLAGCRILVVDDDDELRFLLRTALEMEGAVVSEADGARSAVESAGRVACDVVITDVTMGRSRRDGVRLLESFRASPALARIPVVAFTGCKELQSELTVRGFDRVLIKPLDVRQVAPTIRTLLACRAA